MCAYCCRHCRLEDGNHFWRSHIAPQQPQAIKCQFPTLHHCANIDFSFCQPLLPTGGREELYWKQPLDESSYCNMEGWYIDWTKMNEMDQTSLFLVFFLTLLRTDLMAPGRSPDSGASSAVAAVAVASASNCIHRLYWFGQGFRAAHSLSILPCVALSG